MSKARNQIIIKNEFQQKLIMSTLLITLITLNVIIMSAFVLDEMFGSEDALFNVFNISVAAMELVAVVIVYYVGRKISFHIAGPVYAIERTVKGMAEGNLYQILKLRPGDHFVEVADALNLTIGDYRDRLPDAQKIAAEMAAAGDERAADLKEKLDFFLTEAPDKD